MENNYKDLKKKKRKLKPFVKIILILIGIIIAFIFLYKINFFSSAKNFFQNSFVNIKSSITDMFSKKDADTDSEIKENSKNPDDQFVSVFKKRLPSQDISFASSTILPNGDMKIFLKNTKNEAGYLYVNTKDNVEEVWNTFASILISDQFKKLISTDLPNLNYVDLRFKNKVFYKFNNLTNPSSVLISTSTASTTSTSSVTNSAAATGSTSSPTTNRN